MPPGWVPTDSGEAIIRGFTPPVFGRGEAGVGAGDKTGGVSSGTGSNGFLTAWPRNGDKCWA